MLVFLNSMVFLLNLVLWFVSWIGIADILAKTKRR